MNKENPETFMLQQKKSPDDEPFEIAYFTILKQA